MFYILKYLWYFCKEVKMTETRKTKKVKYTKRYIDNAAEELEKFMRQQNNYFLKDFAVMKKISAQRLSEFAKKNEKFKESLEKAKDIQESKLIKMGMQKGANQAFVIFLLKNVAGYRDRTEVEQKITELPEIKFIY